MFRVEARIQPGADYVNAIVTETEEEAASLLAEWSNRYPHLSIVDTDAPVETETPED